MSDQLFVCGGDGKLSPAAQAELEAFTAWLKAGGKKAHGMSYDEWRKWQADAPLAGGGRLSPRIATVQLYMCEECRAIKGNANRLHGGRSWCEPCGKYTEWKPVYPKLAGGGK